MPLTVLKKPVRSGLVTLQAPARVDATKPLPSRLVMLRWGVNESSAGPIIVGIKTFAASRAWPSLGYGKVCIDFGHNTVPGHPAYNGEPAKVAARSATLSVVPGQGLVFSDIQWTPEGEANKQHYPDLSPAVMLDDDGEVTRRKASGMPSILSRCASLCERPFPN